MVRVCALSAYPPTICSRTCCCSPTFLTPVSTPGMHPTATKVVYVALFLYAVTRPSVLFAGPFLAVAAVEILVSVSGSPVGSLVDSAVRHAFGGDG